jgi:ATP-dependent Clp protease protease subunit
MYLPTFLERTPYGERETNPYSMLFDGRIVLIDRPVDDTTSNAVVAQLLCLEGMDPDNPIELYVNAPGGTLTATAAVYDTIQYVRCPVHTTCLGHIETPGALLVAAGEPGHRAMVPHARAVLHQPTIDPVRGTLPDLDRRATEVTRMRRFVEETLARHTRRDVDQVHADIDRELHLGADDALAYGLVDAVVPSRKRSATDRS